MKYDKIEKELEDLLNCKGRRNFNVKEKFIQILKELKQFDNMEVSTKFLMKLMEENHQATKLQKLKKIKNLTEGLNKKRVKKLIIESGCKFYETNIKDYKFNKWNELCVDIKQQKVAKEFFNKLGEESFIFLKI